MFQMHLGIEFNVSLSAVYIGLARKYKNLQNSGIKNVLNNFIQIY